MLRPAQQVTLTPPLGPATPTSAAVPRGLTPAEGGREAVRLGSTLTTSSLPILPYPLLLSNGIKSDNHLFYLI